ncbi:uncharacterized protein [Dermacentor albipictus]|uniref:uncharacterized protein isoform X2 n=1 Tax=Dermacentor albipictus TaxID=60249 RepID=UPI0031FC0728
MQPLLPRNQSSLPDAARAAVDGDDAAGGPPAGADGGVAEAEEGAVEEDEVERLASWLSLFRMLVIFLPLFALCMPSLLGDWERARRNETSIASRRFFGVVTPPGSSYRRQSARTTCRSHACVAAASSVSLDPLANPCDDLFGHVCNNWIRDHRVSRKAEAWEANRDRRTMDHLHQAALTEDLHKILSGRADGRWLPVAVQSLYRKCLRPDLGDAAELRSKLLESAGLLPWPHNARDTAPVKDISKAVGNAYYFTNEPALLRMGVGADGRAFLAEPRLLLDALTVGPREVAQAAAAVFLSAGGKRPVPEFVNRLEELLDRARRGDDPAPWNTTLRLPETKNDTSRPRVAGEPHSAWSSWNLRTIIEEAFEGRETPDEVVVRAPSYVDALPGVLKQVNEQELLNYLALRTALLASRLLPAGPEKQLLCRLIDVDDTAPARTATEHCIRMIGGEVRTGVGALRADRLVSAGDRHGHRFPAGLPAAPAVQRDACRGAGRGRRGACGQTGRACLLHAVGGARSKLAEKCHFTRGILHEVLRREQSGARRLLANVAGRVRLDAGEGGQRAPGHERGTADRSRPALAARPALDAMQPRAARRGRCRWRASARRHAPGATGRPGLTVGHASIDSHATGGTRRRPRLQDRAAAPVPLAATAAHRRDGVARPRQLHSVGRGPEPAGHGARVAGADPGSARLPRVAGSPRARAAHTAASGARAALLRLLRAQPVRGQRAGRGADPSFETQVARRCGPARSRWLGQPSDVQERGLRQGVQVPTAAEATEPIPRLRPGSSFRDAHRPHLKGADVAILSGRPGVAGALAFFFINISHVHQAAIVMWRVYYKERRKKSLSCSTST